MVTLGQANICHTHKIELTILLGIADPLGISNLRIYGGAFDFSLSYVSFSMWPDSTYSCAASYCHSEFESCQQCQHDITLQHAYAIICIQRLLKNEKI